MFYPSLLLKIECRNVAQRNRPYQRFLFFLQNMYLLLLFLCTFPTVWDHLELHYSLSFCISNELSNDTSFYSSTSFLFYMSIVYENIVYFNRFFHMPILYYSHILSCNWCLITLQKKLDQKCYQKNELIGKVLFFLGASLQLFFVVHFIYYSTPPNSSVWVDYWKNINKTMFSVALLFYLNITFNSCLS